MALKAGRVGVAPSEVDALGKIKTGGSSDSYTKAETDALLLVKEDATNIGGLKFRDNSGQAQYKLPNGDWTNFSSGGGSAPTLIWTNVNVDAGIGATSITFDEEATDDWLLIECCFDKDNQQETGLSLVKIDDARTQAVSGSVYFAASAQNWYAHRNVSAASSTSITFATGGIQERENGQQGTYSDTCCIPTRIWTMSLNL